MADARLKGLGDRPAEITQLDLPSLQAGWASLFGRPPPKGISRRLLELATAYAAQARIFGGLKPAVRRRLLQAARVPVGSANEKPRRPAPGALSPGSRLVREWHGRSHTVEVADGGFLYEGRRYRSISEIARAITGARWSGRRFFGL